LNNPEIERLKQELSKYFLTIDDLIRRTLAGETAVNKDTLNKMNLLMLLQAKTDGDSLNKEKMQQQLDEIIDKVVANSDLSRDDTLLFGDSLYSGQIYTSGSLTAARDNAMDNNLPIYNITECEKMLREMYNLSANDTIVYVTSATDGQLNDKNSTSYKIKAYDNVSKERLNLDYCEDIKNRVEIPLDTSQFNMTLYNELIEQGIDIFDPKEAIFNDRCISYTDNTTNSDTSLNWRREHLYSQKVPMCIGFNCTYDGVNEFNYLNCNCAGLNSDSAVLNSVSEILLSSLSEINIGIVTCYKQIPTVIKF
jgi:hypothetical protein